jgi:cation/acetate symporter
VIPIIAIAIVAIASTVLGALSLRVARSTSDFLVASRSVRPALNASAICGEYLSAGTFLGLAGLVMTFGVDMLWYPVGYTAGYVILLLLVAAPLRRFGAYTIPEFAQGRLGSPLLRRISAGFVLLIGFTYLLPQMKGAGITVATLTGAPYWVGVVLVATIVAGNVAFGGMRGITFVQAFQYFVKVFALSSAAIALLIMGFGVSGVRAFGADGPRARSCLQVPMTAGKTIRATDQIFVAAGVAKLSPAMLELANAAGSLNVAVGSSVADLLGKRALIESTPRSESLTFITEQLPSTLPSTLSSTLSPALPSTLPPALPSALPSKQGIGGKPSGKGIVGVGMLNDPTLPISVVERKRLAATSGCKGVPLHLLRKLPAGATFLTSVDDVLVVPKGANVPKLVGSARVDGQAWERPFAGGSKSRPHPLYAGYSLIIGTFLGTMGLPHILVRFYTNPDGPATRKTIIVVVSLLALYYVWPPVYGVLGRMWAPDLLLTGKTDAVVLLLPQRMVGGLGGQLLTGILAAGAFAAFLSTASGLLISVAGAISHDLARTAPAAGTSIVRRFRQAAIAAAIVAALLGLRAERFDINVLVGWAFAIAASSFCPLLILGVWWRRFTWVGATAGLVAGGGAAAVAIFTVMLGPKLTGWPAALLAQPAAWTVPIAFAGCIVGSLLSQSKVPVDTHARLARMHTPERPARS